MIKLDKHYTDPRLVDLYDLENPLDEDHDFFQQLITELEAQTIIDLGCGTGLHTRAFAGNGRTVYGVDPAPAMLAYARRQPGAEKVIWVDGDADAFGDWSADFALMTGNVAQIFLEDAAWNKTLAHFYAALKKGGVLAFESRNPLARGWEMWTLEQTHQTMDTPHGPLESWLELVDVDEKTVHFQGINRFLDTDETIIVDSTLRFRTQQEIVTSLESVGFELMDIYGRWDRAPFEPTSPAMIFVAKKP
ncbi:MAG: methyltransferase domain-containing protein [Chloroflexota bacterium]